MKQGNTFVLFFAFLTAFGPILKGQNNDPILLEVEDGTAGEDFDVLNENDLTYATITSNGTANYPESSARIISWEVTFPKAGQYDLYIRFRVGSGNFDDDSFFYGSEFGELSPTDENTWTRVNNVANLGYNAAYDVVAGEGNAGSNTWKWLNLSEFMGDETPVIFSVPTDNATYTFQIGAREDGLDIDKVAFAMANGSYTVENLNNGEAENETGSDILPIATGKPKFLGNIYSTSQLPNFAQYWNQVTPENAGKWGSVEGTRDVMNWSGLDAAYQLAKDNGFLFKLHVLIWGNQQPAWIENLPPAEQLEEIQEWFDALAERYPDIDVIEVVNEALHDPPNTAGSGGGNYINALGGNGTTGWDWVINSFKMARATFPDAKLMLNDYNIVNSYSGTTNYLELIGLLQEENLIDQIGVQGHAFSTTGNNDIMKLNLDRLSETGLPIFVTELDIDGPTDAVQLADYQRIFPLFWEHPGVQGVTLWGYRPGLWRNTQKAYLIDTDGSERPALEWLRAYVENNTVVTSTDAPFRIAPQNLGIFPNPALIGQNIRLDLPDNQTFQVQVFDLNGKLVFQQRGISNQSTLPKLEKGLYIVQAFNEDAHYIGKAVIQ